MVIINASAASIKQIYLLHKDEVIVSEEKDKCSRYFIAILYKVFLHLSNRTI